jgi:hypothetical protein
MKKLFITFLMALSIILVSCGGQINKENYDRISNGMSKSQVEKILGEGDSQAQSTYGDYSAESMTWSSGMKIISIVFSNGKVDAKSESGL